MIEKLLINRIKFETFEEFCNRADDILNTFWFLVDNKIISIKEYKDYLYNHHSFSSSKERDATIKGKCWEWLMSFKYEPMNINDLYSLLGNRGKKQDVSSEDKN